MHLSHPYLIGTGCKVSHCRFPCRTINPEANRCTKSSTSRRFSLYWSVVTVLINSPTDSQIRPLIEVFTMTLHHRRPCFVYGGWYHSEGDKRMGLLFPNVFNRSLLIRQNGVHQGYYTCEVGHAEAPCVHFTQHICKYIQRNFWALHTRPRHQSRNVNITGKQEQNPQWRTHSEICRQFTTKWIFYITLLFITLC